ALPRRDGEARARLEAVGERARPVVLARDRALNVPGRLGALIPGGALPRGVTVTVDGRTGSGATTLALELAASVTATGEWASAVSLDATIGGEAAAVAGVALERFAVVPHVEPSRWAAVVAVLIEGTSLVLAEVPRNVALGDARRRVARARERGTVLVALGDRWPADAALRVHVDGGTWRGLDAGGGLLAERERVVRIDAHGDAKRSRVPALADVG